jgi:hypothetical protein
VTRPEHGPKPHIIRGWWASGSYALAYGALAAALFGALGAANWPTPLAIGVPITAALAAGFTVALRLRVELRPDEIVVVNPLRTSRLARRQLRVEKDQKSCLAGGGRPAPMLVLTRPEHLLPVRALATIRLRERDLDAVARQLRAGHRDPRA